MMTGMLSRNLGIAYLGYAKVKSHMPSELRLAVESFLQIGRVSQVQMEKIESIGQTIGLERREIVAATSLPIDNIDSRGRGRISLLSALVAVFAIMCISFVVVVLFAGGNLADTVVPTYTYTPGTRYGSISPRDFRRA